MPIEWRPCSEMPDGLDAAFMAQPGHTWMLASKKQNGKWYAAFGLISAEVRDLDKMYFIPMDIIPPVPSPCP